MGRQWHTVLVVPPSVDVYRVPKFGLVAKGIISSELPMASFYRPEKIQLLNKDFTYSNDTPIPINNVIAKRCSGWCGIYFLRRHTCLLNRSKHKVGEQECEEGQRSGNGEDASEKEDKPMPVVATQAVNPVNIHTTELTHLMTTPETMV